MGEIAETFIRTSPPRERRETSNVMISRRFRGGLESAISQPTYRYATPSALLSISLCTLPVGVWGSSGRNS